MILQLSDQSGTTMMRELRTPEERAELLTAVKAWKAGYGTTADGVLLMMEAFLTPIVAEDKAAAEDPTA